MPSNKKILFGVASWTVFGIGFVLVGYELYGLIILNKSLTGNFIAGITLIYEGLRVASGEIPQKESGA